MSKVELIDYMGSDLTVVNAARVSFDKHTDVFEERDEKLIHYLADHDHWTPFAHPQAQFRITAPIYIANQLKRHQIGFALNEVSRRYVDDPPQFTTVADWRGRPTDGAKQGSSGPLSDNDFAEACAAENRVISFALQTYSELIDNGASPEQARAVLPQSMNTSWYWTGSLYAWARLCKQRLDSHAQSETREYAELISKELREIFPESWNALVG